MKKPSALMEAERRNTTSSSAGGRKPLSDRSNTRLPLASSASCSSFSSSSYLLKKPSKSVASSSQHLHSRDHVNPTESHLEKVQSTTGSTTGTVLGSSTFTPTRPQRRPSTTVGDDDVWEPSPVYVRRQSGSKRKDKEKAIDMPAATKSMSSRDKTNEDGCAGLSKSLIVPRKKKTRQATEVRDDIKDKNFIEQQKAYFAEIDAFELLEEEVASADELE